MKERNRQNYNQQREYPPYYPFRARTWIEPRLAWASDFLKVHLKISDVDGDLIYYTYRWERNKTILLEQDKEILEKGRLKKGESITVTVIPDDKEAQGKPKTSDPLIISNSPPIIVSSPPTSVKENVYTYQVNANDPDHDPITFSLKSGPKGMEMDKNTGLIRWLIRKEDQGPHAIEIQASDDEGTISIQRYTLTIEIR